MAGKSTQTVDGMTALWTTALARRPAPTAISSWPTPHTPMPTTLPARRWLGRTVASRTSAMRDVFSWATPLATAAP
jgi:hypothetical protein